MNDGACDAAGRLWIGSMRDNIPADGEAVPIESTDGQLFCIASGHEPIVLEEQLGCPNAICWSPDGQLMYLADSCDGWIYRYDFDVVHSQVENRKPFSKLENLGVPDGAAVDREGYIWNARWGGSSVVRIDPQGRLVETVPLPVSQPSACCFGGPDGRTLYVTSALFGLNPERLASEPDAGGVFAIELDVPGCPTNRFA